MSSNFNQIKQSFLNRLAPYGLSIPNDWLSQCIEFVQTEFSNRRLPEQSDQVFKQLLDFDLSEIGVKSLPASVFNSPRGTLNGKFFLQVDLCLDATESSYSRIQKLKGTDNENALIDAELAPNPTQFERKEKKNRLLTLHLTDGENKVKAIEYRPISKLKADDLPPGTKIELSGPVMFVNKVLFLSDANIRVLGGQVEELVTPEYLIGAIQNELNARNENFSSPVERIENFDTSSNTSTKKPAPKTEFNRYKSENITQQPSTRQQPSWPNKLEPVSVPDNDEDELLLLNMDLRKLEEKTVQPTPVPNVLSNRTNVAATRNESHGSIKIKRLPSEEISVENLSKLTDENIRPKTVTNEKKKQKCDEKVTELVEQARPMIKTLAELTSAEFLNSCCRINRSSAAAQPPPVFNLSTCTHVVNEASFERFTTPLKQIKLHWYEECLISDASASGVSAFVGNELLAQMLELTCLEARELFKRSASQTNASRPDETREYALFEAKRVACEAKFSAITTCQMHLRFDAERNKFCVVRLENVERHFI